ncbi:MAG TPA: peptidylprolyl isomerase [Candidatus Diapherotrites archaeon]|uniref:Peptidyl-prolyl cis-trans isomerase n=1 Tax=Candidatus Iainarchaeum sp. TaxID=3101447 RepID=A0A7J4IUQ3_9ARCH|nr:peptidylprolyl isomerase [Candidatus Diapherotrites archaeon]
MKERSVVLVEFTGKELSSGKVFDTTSEKTAKESGLYRENAVFGPIPVVVGKGDVLPGLDEALKDMKEGEKRTVKLLPSKAFGERNRELVVIVPLQQFRKRQINPVPGLVVDLNGQYGRVQTVSGGRVRVDLNNDLAGKDVEYEIRIVREIKDAKEKAQLLTEKFFPLRQKAESRIEGDILKVKLPKEISQKLAPLVVPFTTTVKEVMPQIRGVELVDSFEAAAKPKGEAAKQEPKTQEGNQDSKDTKPAAAKK